MVGRATQQPSTLGKRHGGTLGESAERQVTFFHPEGGVLARPDVVSRAVAPSHQVGREGGGLYAGVSPRRLPGRRVASRGRRLLGDDPDVRASVRKKLIDLLAALGVYRLFRFLNRHKVAILFYHGVSTSERFEGIRNYQGKHVGLSRFREQPEFFAAVTACCPSPKSWTRFAPAAPFRRTPRSLSTTATRTRHRRGAGRSGPPA
jgi:hypothetical protein